MTRDNFNELLDKYVTGALSEDARDNLFTLLEQPEYSQYLQEKLETEWESGLYEENEDLSLRALIRTSVNKKIDWMELSAVPTRVHFLRRWGWVAASVMLLVAATILLVDRPTIPSKKDVAQILPGKEGAVLTLADGSQVLLDTIQNGVVVAQGGATVKVVNGALLYEITGSEVVYNTMTTPKGRQFQVTLPDGTKVWLNAASSIRYPTVFAGSERWVKVTGEAYFEVAKNTKMPFRVNVNDKAEVAVLGTHFNVNAYENEETINTTLMEGSVAVSPDRPPKGDQATILKPGQQAQIVNATTIRVIRNADIDKVMAWKNGLFNFEGASLKEVMRQLERWYDIDVVFEKGVPDIRFEGKMTKDVSLNGLLNALKRSDVNFRIEGRKLIVLP